jgi:bacterioferritin-associated ferredoxin
MYICLCLGVTTTTVQQAIDAGARSTKQVAKACGVGSVCGRCRHTIRTMIVAASPTVSAAAGVAPSVAPSPRR